MNNFRTYNLAVEFYRLSSALEIDSHLKMQLSRASSSIALNLAEGAGRFSNKDRARFYQIAFGSLRECQAIIEQPGIPELNQKRFDRNELCLYCYFFHNLQPNLRRLKKMRAKVALLGGFLASAQKQAGKIQLLK